MENIKIIKALELVARTTTIYPEPFASKVKGRAKRALGDQFGIKKFGVNYTVLSPGGCSALMHKHSRSEEFLFILQGEALVVTDRGEKKISAGECIGFLPNDFAHMLVNNSQADVHYIEVGDREPGDTAEYPQDDIQAIQDENGKWRFTHKDGRPYL